MIKKIVTIAIPIILVNFFLSNTIGIFIEFFTKINANSKIQNRYDSLKNEVFIKDLNIMRYESIIEKVSEDTMCKRLIDEAFYETE
jgi:hypothetical protein